MAAREIRLKEIELHSGMVLKEALSAIFHTITFLRSFDSNVEQRVEDSIDIKHAVNPSTASALDRKIRELLGTIENSLTTIGPFLGKTTVVLELSTRSLKKAWFIPSSTHTFEKWILPIVVNQLQPISIKEEIYNQRHSASRPAAPVPSEMGVGTLERLRVFTQERQAVLQALASVIEVVNFSQEHLPSALCSSNNSSFSDPLSSRSALATPDANCNPLQLELVVKLSCNTAKDDSLATSLSKLLHLAPGIG